MTTPEQQAREMLERMGVDTAHLMTSGDLVELANLIAERDALKAELERVKAERDDWGKRWHQERRKVAELQYPGMTGVVKPQSKELAAIKGAGERAYCFAYEWDTPFGAVHRSLSPRPYDGNPPSRIVPLYNRPCAPLTEGQRGDLVMGHLGPIALTGGKLSIYDAFLLGIDAAEAAHNIKGAKP